MAYYNVPTTGAATQAEALREFARRNTPEGRTKLTRDELEALQGRLEGVCYEGDGGSTVYLAWADLDRADLALIVK